MAHVSGRPTIRVSAVDASACHVVNHHTDASDESEIVSAIDDGLRNLVTIDATGNPKNKASAAIGRS
jgi:hypothetical protein